MKRLYTFIGAPCSGKSRAAKVIAANAFNSATYISAGDIARRLANTIELKNKMTSIDLFPDEERFRLEIKSEIDNARFDDIVLDGFPRFGDQAIYFINEMLYLFPKVIQVNVGDNSILAQRAKIRARDDNDTDPVKFINRLNLAYQNMADVERVLGRQFIPIYGIMSSDDASIIKQFKKLVLK